MKELNSYNEFEKLIIMKILTHNYLKFNLNSKVEYDHPNVKSFETTDNKILFFVDNVAMFDFKENFCYQKNNTLNPKIVDIKIVEVETKNITFLLYTDGKFERNTVDRLTFNRLISDYSLL